MSDKMRKEGFQAPEFSEPEFGPNEGSSVQSFKPTVSRRDFLKTAGVIAGAVGLAACGPAIEKIFTPTPESTFFPTQESTPIPTDTPDAPIGSSTETPAFGETRSAVSAEMVKNLTPSLKIGSGEIGSNNQFKTLTYPENTSEGLKQAIDTYYASIQREYFQSDVFYNQDTSVTGGGNWILFAVTKSGELPYSLVKYNDPAGNLGPEQYNDYPFAYDISGKLKGDYTLLDIPGGSVNVIWTHGLPQFVAGERTLQSGDRYFTQAMNYKTLSPDSPWVEITEVAGILAAIPEAPELTYENGPSMEFSPLLPAVWSKEWEGNSVNGMKIPIIIGLSDGVVNDKTPPITPIKGVWMTQEGVDVVTDAFLRAAHYRYTKIMGNTITYEDYLTLLKNNPRGGEVNLLITDNTKKDKYGNPLRREALIDPRQGFSLLMTDKIDPKVGVKHDRNNTSFFGVDGQGKLLLASDYFSRYDFSRVIMELGVPVTNSNFILSSFHILSKFGYVKNTCFVNGDTDNKCGTQTPPPEYTESWSLYTKKLEEMLSNNKYTPLWGLDRP